MLWKANYDFDKLFISLLFLPAIPEGNQIPYDTFPPGLPIAHPIQKQLNFILGDTTALPDCWDAEKVMGADASSRVFPAAKGFVPSYSST